jgi:hypothetical protein
MDQPQASSAHQPTHHPTDTPSPGQRIIVIDAILDVIFSFSTPRAIINISKTCRAARPIAASYFRAAYKPDRLLQRFLPDPAIMRAFRTLQAETGLTIFGKAAYNFLARASPTSTDITATMSLYVDNPYASAVNDFFTGAGYNVELREHELVFLKTGEDDQIINEIALYVGQPDSFDFVDKPQILLVGTCYVTAQVFRYHKTLMSTYPFLSQSLRTSLHSMVHIPFSRLNTMTNSAESPRAPLPRKSLSIPSLQCRNLCTGVSQIVPAGSSLLTSGCPLYRLRSWHLVRPCPRATRYTRAVCWWDRQRDISSSRVSSCGAWCYVHGCSDSPTFWVASN